MLGCFGSMLGEPAALRLRQRRSAEGIFANQTTAIELGFKVCQRARLALGAGTLGETAGQADNKPEAVLKVTRFRFPHDPTPVESQVS